MGKKPDFKALANKAAQRVDQTITKTGGGDFKPPAAGTTVGRFVDYIELGFQKQKPYKGKEKPDAETVQITFELLGKNYVREIEVDGKKKEIADRISFPLTVSLHEKSNFSKLFRKMRYGRDDIKHMAQMLGEAFKITIIHNPSEKDPKKIYANINDSDGNYLVGAPVKQITDDEGNVTETKKLAVREALSPLRMFLWDDPTQEMWDSIFIDGDRTVKDKNGKETTQSKNWLQEKIQKSSGFEGSPIQAFLEGSEELPENPEELEEEVTEDEVTEEEVVDDTETEEVAEETVEDELDEEVEEEKPTKAKAKSVSKTVAKAPAKKVTAASQLAAKKAATKAPVKAAAKAPVKAVAKASAKAAKPAVKAPAKKAAPAAESDKLLKEMGLL